MNFFEKIINTLDGNSVTPVSFGWFHILFFLIIVATTILICYRFKNCSNKTYDRILLILWIILLVFEIYKQLIYSFEYDGNMVRWEYPFHIFPLQLCSSILYMLPFVIFLKDGKLKDCFISYLISFSLFGGVVVTVYPGNVFVNSIGVNIQALLHHGIQVIVGVFILVYNRHKLNVKFFLKSLPVFAVYVIIAMIINCLLAGQINMMYISPYINSSMPVARDVYLLVPYIVYFLLMMIFYVSAGFVFYLLFLYIIKFLIQKHDNNKITKKDKSN